VTPLLCLMLAITERYTLSLHDALPISHRPPRIAEVELLPRDALRIAQVAARAEETQQPDAEVIDGEPLHQSVLPDVVFADHELVALLDAPDLLDLADGLAALVEDYAAD